MKHYAGDVTYASLGFREKNKDTLHPDLSGVMRESQSDFVRTLFPDDSVAASPAKGVQTRGGKKGKKNSADKMTVGSQFMQQLASLSAVRRCGRSAPGVHEPIELQAGIQRISRGAPQGPSAGGRAKQGE